MNYLWYKTVRFYVKISLRSYFKKTKVYGVENIPKNQAVLFVGNHRNGLIDPIMIATTSAKVHLFLTRASAFKNPIANVLLRSINMIPIYRIRDGKDSLKKNQEIFEACFKEFEKKGSVLMFPEGNHGLLRRLRPLSKGFTRIAFGYLDKYPKKDLFIVPVGLNYSNMQEKAGSVSVYYGKAILVNNFYNPTDEKKAIDLLKEKASNSLKELSTDIDDVENHAKIERVLIYKGIDFLDPFKANKLIATTSDWNIPTPLPKHKKSLSEIVIQSLFTINTLIPMLIWRYLKDKPKDIVLIPTFRLGLSAVLIPLFYLLQSWIVCSLSNPYWGFIYLISSILLLVIYKNSIHTDSFTTNPS